MNLEEGMKLQTGDLVQVSPDADERFGGCILQVTARRSSGVEGYALAPGDGPMDFRTAFENVERVGRAKWIEDSQTSAYAANTS